MRSRRKNGASSPAELVERTARCRRAPRTPGTQIGRNLLTDPFFFDEDQWIPVPPDWPRHVQRGYIYDTATETGSWLRQEVEQRLEVVRQVATVHESQFGEACLTRARLGQGAFQTFVADAYRRRCAVTGECSLPALEAAHVKAHAAAGPNRTRNGLLLRADIHRLFNDGHVTVDPDFLFVVSQRLRDEFENGRACYELSGTQLVNLPDRSADRPGAEFLEWHNSEVYLE